MAQESVSAIAEYDMSTSPRGLVLVFSFGNGERNFIEDARKLESIYKEKDYEVIIKYNLSKDDIFKELKNICHHPKLSEFSTLHTFIISHGTVGSQFQASDGRAIGMKEILPYYSDSHCPGMEGKPKLFFCQFCRGGSNALQLNTEGWEVPRKHAYAPQSITKEALNDIYIVYSSQSDLISYAHTQNGSPFIEAFCNTLRNHSTLYLEDFMLVFRNKYGQMRYGQPIEERKLNVTKKFRFIPERNQEHIHFSEEHLDFQLEEDNNSESEEYSDYGPEEDRMSTGKSPNISSSLSLFYRWYEDQDLFPEQHPNRVPEDLLSNPEVDHSSLMGDSTENTILDILRAIDNFVITQHSQLPLSEFGELNE